MDREIQNRISYTVACISEFSHTHNLSYRDAYLYLKQFGGIAFLKDCYDVEHLLSIDDAVKDLTILCKRQGGLLELTDNT